MVTFICYHCNKTLKKPQIEKHQTQCRNPAKLICIDCKKMFNGNEHNEHIKCLTEKELYWGQYANKSKPAPVVKEESKKVKKQAEEQAIAVPEWKGWRNEINKEIAQMSKKQIKLSKIKQAVVKDYLKHFPDTLIEEANQLFDEKIEQSSKLTIVQIPYIMKKINE